MLLKTLTIDAADAELLPLARWRGTVLYPQLAAATGPLVSLRGPQAHSYDFGKTIDNARAVGTPFVYVSAMGHGTANEFTSDGIVVFDSRDHTCFAGAIVHLLSCFTALQLGVALAANGTRAFLGYKSKFWIAAKLPLSVIGITLRELQEIYFECAAQVDVALTSGCSVQDSHELVIAAFDQRILELEEMSLVEAAVELELNRDAFCSPVVDPRWGDATAQL